MCARRHYSIVCSSCGARYEDDGLILDCPMTHEPAFLRTEYDSQYRPGTGEHGLFRHAALLPATRTFAEAPEPVVYPATQLGHALGLTRLWVAFSGYWPERDTAMLTGTFKELEAYTVLGRLPETPPVLVVASAGNTAAAFAWAATRYRVPCLIVLPASAMERMRFPGPLDPCVRLVVLDGATYNDAIACAELFARLPKHQAEGGARNVARRDGLGVVMLSAADALGRLPDVYVQAVGSGTGAIGAHEAARRLRGDSDVPLPRVLMCQNTPYAPLLHAWRSDPGPIPGSAMDVLAPELTNGRPPYAMRGGVRDVLAESGGEVLAVDNEAALAAMVLCEQTEGIDIEPGAGVALAALAEAVRSGRVSRDEVVLLNVTGGGRARLAEDMALVPAEPWLRIPAGPSGASDDPAEPMRRLLDYVATPSGA
uniref:Cysteic acid synthase n=1 Tax=Kibdelosporangium sp. AK-AA56 TaxID=1962669 RepID=A0A1Y1DBF6_9PSEU|nr:cysteic acid synthase [Kibdelosporangium sp. AK-AA56]